MPETQTEKDDDVVLDFSPGLIFKYRDSTYKTSSFKKGGPSVRWDNSNNLLLVVSPLRRMTHKWVGVKFSFALLQSSSWVCTLAMWPGSGWFLVFIPSANNLCGMGIDSSAEKSSFNRRSNKQDKKGWAELRWDVIPNLNDLDDVNNGVSFCEDCLTVEACFEKLQLGDGVHLSCKSGRVALLFGKRHRELRLRLHAQGEVLELLGELLHRDVPVWSALLEPILLLVLPRCHL